MDFIGIKYVDNLFNYLIDIVNIIFTGILILTMGRKCTIFTSVLIASGLTIVAFTFSFLG